MPDLTLWDRREGSVDIERDADALLMQWLSSDDPACWRRAGEHFGWRAVRSWLERTQGLGLSTQDAEFWRVVLDLPRGSMTPHEDLILWTLPNGDEEHAWLALVA